MLCIGGCRTHEERAKNGLLITILAAIFMNNNCLQEGKFVIIANTSRFSIIYSRNVVSLPVCCL